MNDKSNPHPTTFGNLSALRGMKLSFRTGAAAGSQRQNGEGPQAGLLIVNADDWGRDQEATDRTLECVLCRTVSSVSAMVFMEDSERAAVIAREHEIDAGLHLNLTTPFSSLGASSRLVKHQQRLAHYLRRHRLAQIVFHPGLKSSFEYVVFAQIDEFRRLYGAEPDRLDGHHHLHLCTNVILGKLLPEGTIVRRNFSFRPGEKSFGNRLYRKTVDWLLARRHGMVDFFFTLPPMTPLDRLERIVALARQHIVELETHPVNPEEHQFLTGGGFFHLLGDIPIARRFAPLKREQHPESSAKASNFRNRLSCSLPYLAFGATACQSLLQLTDYL